TPDIRAGDLQADARLEHACPAQLRAQLVAEARRGETGKRLLITSAGRSSSTKVRGPSRNCCAVYLAIRCTSHCGMLIGSQVSPRVTMPACTPSPMPKRCRRPMLTATRTSTTLPDAGRTGSTVTLAKPPDENTARCALCNVARLKRSPRSINVVA